MGRLRNWLAVLVAAAMLVSTMPLMAFANAGEAATAFNEAQQCGDNAYWELADGVLTISGTGAVWHYSFMGDDIPEYAPYASTVKKIVIEDGITELGNESFESFDYYGEGYVYSGLTEIEIPSTVTKIGANAFAGSTSIEVIDLPASVTSLGVQVFSGCTALKEINVAAENAVFSSDNGVLFTADGSELITYPLGNNATEYTVPSTVTKIRECAFAFEEDLEKVIFNEGLVMIADTAFHSCSNLNNVYLPSTLKALGGEVFQCCTSLDDFTIPATIECF